MAKFSVAEATAIGEKYGQLLKEAAEAKGALKGTLEARVEGFLEALAMSRIASGNTNWGYWDGRSLKAANAVLRAAKLPERDSMPIPYLSTESTGTASSSSKRTKGRKTKSSGKATTAKTKSSTAATPEKPKASRPRPDHYVIDEGTQCLGKTKSSGFKAQCNHWAVNGTGYCLQHWDQIPEESVPEDQPKAEEETPKGSKAASAERPKVSRGRRGRKPEASEEQPEAETPSPVKPGTSRTTVTHKPLPSERVAEILAAKQQGGTPSLKERRKAQLAAEEEAAKAAFLEDAKAENAAWLAKQTELEIAEAADEVGTSMAAAMAEAATKSKTSSKPAPEPKAPEVEVDPLEAKLQDMIGRLLEAKLQELLG